MGGFNPVLLTGCATTIRKSGYFTTILSSDSLALYILFLIFFLDTHLDLTEGKLTCFSDYRLSVQVKILKCYLMVCLDYLHLGGKTTLTEKYQAQLSFLAIKSID